MKAAWVLLAICCYLRGHGVTAQDVVTNTSDATTATSFITPVPADNDFTSTETTQGTSPPPVQTTQSTVATAAPTTTTTLQPTTQTAAPTVTVTIASTTTTTTAAPTTTVQTTTPTTHSTPTTSSSTTSTSAPTTNTPTTSSTSTTTTTTSAPTTTLQTTPTTPTTPKLTDAPATTQNPNAPPEVTKAFRRIILVPIHKTFYTNKIPERTNYGNLITSHYLDGNIRYNITQIGIDYYDAVFSQFNSEIYNFFGIYPQSTFTAQLFTKLKSYTQFYPMTSFSPRYDTRVLYKNTNLNVDATANLKRYESIYYRDEYGLRDKINRKLNDKLTTGDIERFYNNLQQGMYPGMNFTDDEMRLLRRLSIYSTAAVSFGARIAKVKLSGFLNDMLSVADTHVAFADDNIIYSLIFAITNMNAAQDVFWGNGASLVKHKALMIDWFFDNKAIIYASDDGGPFSLFYTLPNIKAFFAS